MHLRTNFDRIKNAYPRQTFVCSVCGIKKDLVSDIPLDCKIFYDAEVNCTIPHKTYILCEKHSVKFRNHMTDFYKKEAETCIDKLEEIS